MTESRRVRPPRARAARIRGVLAWSEPRAGGTIPYLAAKLTCPAESTSMMTPGLVSRSQARTQQAALDARDASYSATTSLAAGPREPMYRPTMSSGRVGGLVSCRYHPATVQSGRVLVSATIRTWRSLHPWSSASASSRSRSSTPGWSRSRTASIALAWLMASDQPTFTGQTPVGPPQPRGSEQAAPATTVCSPRRSGGLLGHRFRTQSRAGCGARFRWRGGFGAGPLDASGDDPAPRRALPAKARHWRAAPRLAGQSEGRALPPAPRPVVACLERSRRPQAAIPPRWPPAGGEPARRGHTPAVGAGYTAPRPGPSPAATRHGRWTTGPDVLTPDHNLVRNNVQELVQHPQRNRSGKPTPDGHGLSKDGALGVQYQAVLVLARRIHGDGSDHHCGGLDVDEQRENRDIVPASPPQLSNRDLNTLGVAEPLTKARNCQRLRCSNTGCQPLKSRGNTLVCVLGHPHVLPRCGNHCLHLCITANPRACPAAREGCAPSLECPPA